MITADFIRGLGLNQVRDAGTEVRASCPLPQNHAHGDSTPSWSINVETGVSYCAGCGRGFSFHSLLRILCKDEKEVGRLLELARIEETRAKARRIGRYAEPYALPGECVADDYDRNLEVSLAVWSQEQHSYMESRGFPHRLCVQQQIGYDTLRRRVVFPIRSRMKVVGAVGRGVDDNVQPKYWFYHRLQKGKYFYYPQVFSPRMDFGALWLVEGPTDALRLHQFGYGSVNAIFGRRITTNQIIQVVRFVSAAQVPLVLCFDNDDAGQECTEHALSVFRGRVPGMECAVAKYPARYKDPGALPVDGKRLLTIKAA